MEIIGRQIELAVGVESTRNTAVATPDRGLKKVVANILPRATKVNDDASWGRMEQFNAARIVQQWVDGELQGITHADAIGYLLYALYGTVESEVVSGEVYDHAFTLLQQAQRPTLTLFAKDGDVSQDKINGCVVGSLELTCGVDEFLRFTANFEGIQGVSDTTAISYDEEQDFIGRDVQIKVATTPEGIAGATPIAAHNTTIRWDVGPNRRHRFGSRYPATILTPYMGIQIDVTRDLTDTTFRDMWQNDAARYVEVTIRGQQDIGGTNNPEIVLYLNKAQVTAWDRSGANDDVVEETFTMTAFMNQEDEQQSDVRIRNNTASYAVGS